MHIFPAFYVRWPLITTDSRLLHSACSVVNTDLYLHCNLISYYKVKLVNW